MELPTNFDPRKGMNLSTPDARDSAQKVCLTYSGNQCMPPQGMQSILVECEVYLSPDEIMIHSACPKCRHMIKIDSSNKEITFDPERGIFVEAFICPWEMGDAMAGGDRRIDFGVGLCNMRVEYAGFEIRDA